MSSKTIISFSFPCYAHHRDLHSFPTRRSSDLYDNIPVLSWLLLGGKCRNCKNRISVLYPAVELLTALLFVACYLAFGASVEALKWAVFSSLLIVVMITDVLGRILPVKLNFTGFVLC